MPSNETTPHQGGNATAIAAAAAKAAAAKAQLTARRNAKMWNQRSVEYFAAAMVGVILLFTIFHWSRYLYSRHATWGIRTSRLMKIQVSVARMFRHVLTHRVPGFTSIGHAVLVLAYLGTNIALTVTNLTWTSLMPIANRLGWMAIVNVAFVTFLALKNTPLAFLTAYSYEKLNPLHQVGGYTTIIYVFLHAAMQCVAFGLKLHRKQILLEKTQIHGITAGASLLVLLVFALLIKRMRYEVFYLSHIFMYIVFLVNVAFHQPELADKVVIITLVAASLWGSDRLLRLWRIFWYSYDNRATLVPLPNGGTRIILRRSPTRAVPGTHCFLWIPEIRAFETHPFTVVSKSPTSLEMVVAAYDGFTNDLHTFAEKFPGASLRASFDGPYGAVPNFAKSADRVILVAGGSGASFTFGVALDIVRKLNINLPKPKIDFIWSVREPESFTWFSKELNELRSSPRVNVILHSTRLNFDETPPSPSSQPISPIIGHDEEKGVITAHGYNGEQGHIHDSPIDHEKPRTLTHMLSTSAISSSSSKFDNYPTHFPRHITSLTNITQEACAVTTQGVLPGRPDVETLIRNIVAGADDEERVAIAACGPETLMWTVRRTATSCIHVKGPSIELYCEQFGW